jgi:mono/diheme cytochrome c family protein
MFPFMRVVLATAACCIILIVLGNIEGFFKSSKDDPHWVEPAGAKKDDAGAGGGTAAGPGGAVYAKICASCHQGNGKGLPGVYPALAGSALVQGESTAPLRIILHGFQGKIVRNGKEYNGVMQAWGSLSDQEIADVLTFVRASWGNTGAAVDVATVTDVRAKTKGKSSGYTESELSTPL